MYTEEQINDLHPHATMSEYFVWKDNLCVLQTQRLDTLNEFMDENEETLDQYEFMRVITNVSYMDDEQIGFIRQFSGKPKGT